MSTFCFIIGETGAGGFGYAGATPGFVYVHAGFGCRWYACAVQLQPDDEQQPAER